MEITNPAVTDGVNLFVNIVVILIAFVTAVSLIDAKKTSSKD
jgi:nucleoside permease NupC